MIPLFKMAFRDLKRNRRRSFFSALALGMGVSLLLMMASVIAGEMRGALETTIKLQSGHLQLHMPTYEEENTSLAWGDLIEDPVRVAEQMAAFPEVVVATPRLHATGIVALGEETLGVRIMGIDPASPANAPYSGGMVSGQYLTADDREGVLLGKSMTDKLERQVGDEIYLMVNTSSGDVAEQVFVIRGIYTTRTPGFDESTILMPLEKAQDIAQANNHASAIFVLLQERDQTDAVAARLQNSGFGVETWQQANALMIETEQMSNAYMAVLYLIILAITASVIVNTLVMAVFERTREIGILAAMGMKPARIMAMFFAESFLLAVGGVIIGLALGGLLVTYLANVGIYIGNMGVTGILLGERIYAYLTLKDTVNLTITAFITTLLAALYPALLAARLEPVDALRGGK